MRVDIPCDVQQVDETGFVWAFLDEAREPAVITRGAIVVTGDVAEPAFARIIDIVGEGNERRVHLDVLPGAPGRYLEAAARAHLAEAAH